MTGGAAGVETVDAASTIRLLESTEALYLILALILVFIFLDNAHYHHFTPSSCRTGYRGSIAGSGVPAYWPHLNPIERLWGVMHKHNWANLRDSVTDNFRVISPNDFRVMA